VSCTRHGRWRTRRLLQEGIESSSDAPRWLQHTFHALVVINVASVLLTALAAAKRARALLHATGPFSPAWAALTFPLVSSCLVAVLLERLHAPRCAAYDALADAADRDVDSSCSVWHGSGWSWAMVTWAWRQALVPITLVAVTLVDVAWLASVPRWVCLVWGGALQKRFDSVQLPEEEAVALLAELGTVSHSTVVLSQQPAQRPSPMPTA